MNLWIVIPALVVIALAFVIGPVGLATATYYATRRRATCPETHADATVKFGRSALAEILASPRLRVVQDCSRWPERRTCGQECRLPEAAAR